MTEIFTTISSHAPALIFIASFFDIFFISGYLFYGFAMIGSVGMLLANDMISFQALVITASAGSIMANTVNFFIGKYLGSTAYIKKRIHKITTGKIAELADTKNLFIFMAVCRFFAFFRPAYGILLGTLNVSSKKFILYESIIGFSWVIFWGCLIKYSLIAVT